MISKDTDSSNRVNLYPVRLTPFGPFRTGAHEDQLAFGLPINQQPIRADMAFAVSGIIARQDMIPIAFRQRFSGLQGPYKRSQLLQIPARRQQFLEVLLEPAFADQLKH
jgi:hypothetical protein